MGGILLQGIKILGTGHYSPQQIVTNEYLSKFMDTNDEWITTRTGISKRHVSDGEPTWYMAAKAAEQALEASGVSADEIDLIILSSTTEDFYLPSGACMVQREIGATGCMAIDINCACSGFVYALDMARRYLAFDDVKKVLVIAGESLSKIIDYEDRSTCILFGDGAGACIVEASDSLYASFHGADGNGAKFLVARHMYEVPEIIKGSQTFDDGLPNNNKRYIIQDGKEVYKFATSTLPMAAEKAAERAGISIEDIDFFVPHQANIRIIETAAKKLKVSMDKFIVNISEYANTSSASIPLAFDEAVRDGRIKRGDKICFVGFGAGLTYGAVVFEY